MCNKFLITLAPFSTTLISITSVPKAVLLLLKTTEGWTQATPKDRLTLLKQLYDCTSPEANEKGVCTITYPKAGPKILAGQPFHTRADARDFTSVWSGPRSSFPNYASQGTIVGVTYGGRMLYDENHHRCFRQGFECFNGSSCTHKPSECPIEKTPIPGGNCRFDPGTWPSGISSNDNNKDSQCIVVKPEFALPPGAPHDNLEISYKVDASCRRVNSLLARCEKHYVQGKFDTNQMDVDDHSQGIKSLMFLATQIHQRSSESL